MGFVTDLSTTTNLTALCPIYVIDASSPCLTNRPAMKHFDVTSINKKLRSPLCQLLKIGSYCACTYNEYCTYLIS